MRIRGGHLEKNLEEATSVLGSYSGGCRDPFATDNQRAFAETMFFVDSLFSLQQLSLTADAFGDESSPPPNFSRPTPKGKSSHNVVYYHILGVRNIRG